MTRWLALPILAALLLAGCASPGGEPLQRGNDPPGLVDHAASGWPPLEDATIRPGVDIVTPERVCPSNFVFTRPDNQSLYIGTSAHCVRDMPIGAVATVGGPENLAVLAYSSFQTMAERGETDELALQYNDFAVFYVDSTTRPAVHPAMLPRGGPVAEADFALLDVGDRVHAYANASAPVGVSVPGAPGPAADAPPAGRLHEGVITGKAGEWAYLAYAAPPALPNGMGGGVLDDAGRAVGIVVNLGVAPNPGANGIARLDTVMAYAQEHANLHMRLATWDLLDEGLVPLVDEI